MVCYLSATTKLFRQSQMNKRICICMIVIVIPRIISRTCGQTEVYIFVTTFVSVDLAL